MSSTTRDPSSLLRWYPPAWRERYGEELVAMVEEDLQGGRPSLRTRSSLIVGGIRERAHQAGLAGDGDPARRLQAGSLVVLACAAAFAFAGGSYAKLAEHFPAFMPAGPAGRAQVAYDLVEAFAVLSGIAVATGALLILPAFVKLLRQDGWLKVRRPIVQLVAFWAVTAAAIAGLGVWARHLSETGRNGGDVAYTVAFLGVAVLIAGTLAFAVRAAIATTRKLEVSLRVLKLEAGLAAIVFVSMLVMTGATAWWWATVAQSAPGFIGDSNGIAPPIVGTMALMLLADLGSAFGVNRLARR